MIIAANKDVEQIVNKIHEDMKIDEPGKGIMFVLDVNKAYGL